MSWFKQGFIQNDNVFFLEPLYNFKMIRGVGVTVWKKTIISI